MRDNTLFSFIVFNLEKVRISFTYITADSKEACLRIGIVANTDYFTHVGGELVFKPIGIGHFTLCLCCVILDHTLYVQSDLLLLHSFILYFKWVIHRYVARKTGTLKSIRIWLRQSGWILLIGNKRSMLLSSVLMLLILFNNSMNLGLQGIV